MSLMGRLKMLKQWAELARRILENQHLRQVSWRVELP